jgi:prephenate dehydratase
MVTEQKRTVAFQGERGAFSEIAAEKYFIKDVLTTPFYSFEEVFSQVKRGSVDYGIIPIENTLYGSVFENYDLLLNYSLQIIAEINLQIHHYLLADKKYTISDLKKIYSHPQAIGQCSAFLKKLKNVEIIPSYDTAGSVIISKENKKESTAAIASIRASEIYGMKILKKQIQNNRENYTRFLIIAKKKNTGIIRNPKTSICFDLKSIPGALHKALGVFASRGIDLVKIESRPIPHKPFQYTFYIDLIGNLNDKKIKNTLKGLTEIALSIKKFGSYQIGKTYTS